jgi:flavin-dependent dehydrogenase
LGNGIVNAAAMVKANVAKNLSSVFSLSSELMVRASQWQPASEPVSTAPLLFVPPLTSADGVLLCGDAAAFLDPFAGDGISMALQSGRFAALSLRAYLRGERSLQSAIERYDRDHRELIQPALKSAAWLRRLANMPRPLRTAAISALRFPAVQQTVVRHTRVRIGSARNWLLAGVGGV